MSDEEDAALTVIDDRWSRARRAVRGYEHAHLPEFAGSWVEQSPPRMHLAFTGDVDAHRSALLERLPDPDFLHVHAAERSEAELKALAERIWDDVEELENHGLHVLSTWLDPVGNVVVVDVVSTDAATAAAALAERYGDGVRIDWQGPSLTRTFPVEWSHWDAVDARRLGVRYTGLAVDSLDHVEVHESQDEVRIGVFDRGSVGSSRLLPRGETAVVTLARPLAGRLVVDAATGEVRPRRPTAPGRTGSP
jgi:hypothetical protein